MFPPVILGAPPMPPPTVAPLDPPPMPAAEVERLKAKYPMPDDLPPLQADADKAKAAAEAAEAEARAAEADASNKKPFDQKIMDGFVADQSRKAADDALKDYLAKSKKVEDLQKRLAADNPAKPEKTLDEKLAAQQTYAQAERNRREREAAIDSLNQESDRLYEDLGKPNIMSKNVPTDGLETAQNRVNALRDHANSLPDTDPKKHKALQTLQKLQVTLDQQSPGMGQGLWHAVGGHVKTVMQENP